MFEAIPWNCLRPGLDFIQGFMAVLQQRMNILFYTAPGQFMTTSIRIRIRLFSRNLVMGVQDSKAEL